MSHPPAVARPVGAAGGCRRTAWAIPLLLLCVGAGGAHADTGPQVRTGWLDQPFVTGTWGGMRKKLGDQGIVLHAGYLSEMAGNPVGGKSQGFAYAHQVELGAEVDFRKLTGSDLGTLSISFTERAGDSLSAKRIGDVEEVQEVFGSGETVRLSRFTVRRPFGRRIEAGIGYNNTEEDFAASSLYWGKALYCFYQSLAFCGKPPTLGQNSGYTFIPRAVPSGWVKFYPTDDRSVVVALGAYAVDPTIPNAHNGFKVDLHDDTGALLPIEIGYHRGQSDEQGAFPGTYRAGAYYDTSTVRDVTTQVPGRIPSDVGLNSLSSRVRSGRYGGWLLADQMVERDATDPKRGVVVFAMFTYGDQRTALLPYYGAVGLARKGSFADRPDDILAAGLFVAAFNSRLARYEGLLAKSGLAVPRQAQEIGLEVNYAVQEGWLTMRPGIQYKWHPSGQNEIRNALVLDLQTTINF